MEKLEMMNRIASTLAGIGIRCQFDAGTDISIEAGFLDAGWSTGEKRIEYQSATFLDEATRTLHFWELTKESGSGFSFGGGSESSFQSGTTLFRKVKSVGYGPDGKAYEYSLDIGAIVRTFKETAKQYGWKFKVVLKKERAMWPQGYVPQTGMPPIGQQPYQNTNQIQYQDTNQAQSQNPYPPPYPNPGPFMSQSEQKGQEAKANPILRFHIPFTVLLLLMLVFFGFGGVTWYGWLIGIIMLGAAFVFRKKLLSFGCGGILAIWAGIAIILLIFFAGSP